MSSSRSNRSSSLWLALIGILSWVAMVDAHIVLTYPGWRGDNLVTNDTFPFGMQWMYPCEYMISVLLCLVTSFCFAHRPE